jgi:predicted TIM-barrel fold metal-dependent hydrolase
MSSEAIAMSELDEIRAILRDVAVTQQQMQVQQQQMQQQVQVQQQQTQRNIDELGQILRESIPDLTEMVGTVLMSLDEFSAELRSIFASDSASRAAERLAETRVRNEFRSAMLGLQTETRSILRELAELRQQRQNGNSSQE